MFVAPYLLPATFKWKHINHNNNRTAVVFCFLKNIFISAKYLHYLNCHWADQQKNKLNGHKCQKNNSVLIYNRRFYWLLLLKQVIYKFIIQSLPSVLLLMFQWWLCIKTTSCGPKRNVPINHHCERNICKTNNNTF